MKIKKAHVKGHNFIKKKRTKIIINIKLCIKISIQLTIVCNYSEVVPADRDTNEIYLGENGLKEEQGKNSIHIARNN